MSGKLGYKQTEIGTIPEDWAVKELQDVTVSIDAGQSAPQGLKYYENGNLPFIRMRHLGGLYKNKFISKYDLINESAVKHNQMKLYEKGSIILPKSGESIKLERRAILARDSYVVNHLSIINADHEKIDETFLFYYLSLIKLSKLINQTTTPSINLSQISRIIIPFPPLQEQKNIASILSLIDDKLWNTNEIIVETQQLKRGLLQQLITKGIGHTQFKQTELGEIPEEWHLTNLSEIAEIIMGQSPSSEYYNKLGLGIPLLNGPTEFGEKYPNPVIWTTVTPRKCQIGDILLCVRGNTVGKINVANQEYCLGRGIAAIRNKDELINQAYLFSLMESLSLKILQKAYGTGSTFPNINRGEISAIRIALPSLDEQRKILLTVNSINDEITNEKLKEKLLTTMKTNLMKILLTGEIRVKVD